MTQQTANPYYAIGQLLKAAQTQTTHPDAATRARAAEKIQQWQQVFTQMLDGSLRVGSRTPLRDTPAWVTLEVAAGGFATGHLLAGGALQAHEQELLELLDLSTHPQPRLALNHYFLSEAGFNQLLTWLENGKYHIAAPEEGALLVVACLVQLGLIEQAAALVETLTPFFEQLRFYPQPTNTARYVHSLVHLQTVAECIDSLQDIQTNPRVLAQREAVNVWLPFYDRVVALMLETVVNDQPCQAISKDWLARAQATLNDYERLKKRHTLTSKHRRPNHHQYQLREFMRQYAKKPQSVQTGSALCRISYILKSYVAKRGEPHSAHCQQKRARQVDDCQRPMLAEMAKPLIQRLQALPQTQGLSSTEAVLYNIDAAEAQRFSLPFNAAMPERFQRRLQWAVDDSLENLMQRGLLTSGETLARVLPQLTADLHAAVFTEPSIRHLYAALYRAFRQRRSLLLLNLEHQVRFNELPWVSVLETQRSSNNHAQTQPMRQTLQDISALVLSRFPQTITPNKLLQELRALIKQADLTIPLVDELAVDIFMGQFTPKFSEAVHSAATLLTDSLYARYYAIDYAAVCQQLPLPQTPPTKNIKQWFSTQSTPDFNTQQLVKVCAERANLTQAGWSRHNSENGMIIEQQQILTTHNLASLWQAVPLAPVLQTELITLAKSCFTWILKQHILQTKQWQALSSWKLYSINEKLMAYAWRQMVFYLSLVPAPDLKEFWVWAEIILSQHPNHLIPKFAAHLTCLKQAAQGEIIPREQQFLGWQSLTKAQ